MVVLLFFFVATLLAQNTVSLIKIIECFDTLKKRNSHDPFLCKQFGAYRDACNDAYKSLKNNRPVADHVWYRAEIAKTIYFNGFELFKNNIERYLFDWSALARVTNKQITYWQDISNSWTGGYAYYLDDDIKELSNSINKFYLLTATHSPYKSVLCDVNHKIILQSPANGLLFFYDFYYGLIDYDQERAILYDSSIGKIQEIDFSNLAPWNVLKENGTDKASIFFNQNKMCLTFWNYYRYGTEPGGQIIYEIRSNGAPVDLSLLQNYKSSDIPICWIDRSSHFAKYSHAWVSFYVVQFFFKHLAEKSMKTGSLLNRHFLFFCMKVIFFSFLMLCGIMGIPLSFLQPCSSSFKNNSIRLLSFLMLFMGSFVLRGMFMGIYS